MSGLEQTLSTPSNTTPQNEKSDSEQIVLANPSDFQPDAPVPRPQARARRRNRVIHSCLECRRRKMRCDRSENCENCRASGYRCIYVTSEDADAQLPYKLTQIKDAKDAIDDTLLSNVQDRSYPPKRRGPHRKRSRTTREALSDEEHHFDNDDDDHGYLEPTPLAVQDAAYASHADDDDHEIDSLGVKIGRMRLSERIGGLYRPWIADEILSSLHLASKQVPVLVPSPPISASTDHLIHPNVSSVAPSVNVILGNAPPHEPLAQYIPPRSIADKLLEHYWNAVHPVARILHRPSFAQRYETLWELIENAYQVTPSLVALVCAVLFSSLASMPNEQTLAMCRVPKSELCARLKMGAEVALGKAELLRSTKTETVQAFVAYLLPICINEISRAHSVLTGMVIRLAECMGLHRDPTEYGFSPAECQTRRLIWYQICYLDLKTSEIQGPRPFIHRDGYTTRLPLNIAPSTPLLPNTSRTWNDMTFSMIRIECQEMQRESLVLRQRVDRKTLSLTKAISKIETFRIEMDAKYGPFLNTASPGPMQKMASLVMKMFVDLFYLILLHRYMNSVKYRIPDRLRQIVLSKGTEALEAAVELDSDEELQQWAWYSASYHQYHTAFLLLHEVFIFPMRREANRIWQCLDWIFADVLAGIAPLSSATPTLPEIIAHRDIKARYLLTTIVERMRVYQQAKGLKSPIQFKPSMIVITPQRVDDSDPRMSLNYAHGEPDAALGGPNIPIVSSSQIPCPTEKDAGTAQLVSIFQDDDSLSSLNEWQHALDNSASYRTSSSRAPSPLVHYVSSEHDGINSTRLHPGHFRSQEMSATPNSFTMTHSGGGNADVTEPQMLEIDWNLWDTMFPPQTNNGNLDIPSDCLWLLPNSSDS